MKKKESKEQQYERERQQALKDAEAWVEAETKEDHTPWIPEWEQKYQRGIGLTVGKCEVDMRVKIGNRIGTILHKSDSSVTLAFEPGQTLNIAPGAEVDEVLEKRKAKPSPVNQSAPRLEKKESIMTTKKSIEKKAARNAKVDMKALKNKAATNGKPQVEVKVEVKAPRDGTVAKFIFDCLKTHVSDETIEKRIRKEFPKSTFQKAAMNGYRRDFLRDFGMKF